MLLEQNCNFSIILSVGLILLSVISVIICDVSLLTLTPMLTLRVHVNTPKRFKSEYQSLGDISRRRLMYPIYPTVLTTSLEKTFFAWRFILKETNLF